jgi:outer membrane protein
VKRSLLCVALLSLSGSAWAADGLLDIYQAAQLYDATFAAAKSDLAAGHEAAAQGRAMLLPQVGLSGSTSYTDMKAAQLNGSPYRYNANTYTLTVSQPLYRKYNYATYLQADYRVKASEMMFAIAQQDLILRVATAYFDVLRAQDVVSLLQAQHTAIAEQLNQAKRLFEAKVGTLTDLDETAARFDQTVAQELEAKNVLDVKQRVLQRSIGKRPIMLKAFNEMPLLSPVPNDLTYWIEAAAKQDPQIEVKKATVAYMIQEIEKSRSGHFPTLDFVMSGTQANNPSYFLYGRQDTASATLQFNMPLYQGGQTSSKVRETLASKEKSEHDLDEAVRTSELLTSESFLAVNSGIAKVTALEQSVKSSERALHSTKMGHEVGLRTSVDVLNAQQQLFAAKRDLSTARYDYVISRLKLKSAVGTLGDEDVAAIDQWLKN